MVIEVGGGELQPAHLEKIAVARVAVGETHGEVVARAGVAHVGGVVHPHEVRHFQKPRRTMGVRGDVEADIGAHRRDLFQPFHPLLPKEGVECDRVVRGGGMSVSLPAAGAFCKAVYLEISDIVHPAELRHPFRDVADVARIARADIAGSAVDVIAEFFEETGIPRCLRRIAAARSEPHPECAAELGGEGGFEGETLREFVIESPKSRRGVVHPAVVHDIAVERAKPRRGKPFRHGGEGASDALRCDVQHIVVPAVELYAEARGTGESADIGEERVLLSGHIRAFCRTEDGGRRGVDSALRDIGEHPARVIDEAHFSFRHAVVPDRAFDAEKEIAVVDGLSEPCDGGGDEGMGEKGRGVQEGVVRGHGVHRDGMQEHIAGGAHFHAFQKSGVSSRGIGDAHLEKSVRIPYGLPLGVRGGGSERTVENVLFSSRRLRPYYQAFVRWKGAGATCEQIFDARADTTLSVKKESFPQLFGAVNLRMCHFILRLPTVRGGASPPFGGKTGGEESCLTLTLYNGSGHPRKRQFCCLSGMRGAREKRAKVAQGVGRVCDVTEEK